MERSVIKKLINIWDPLGVYGLAPDDEYNEIIARVAVFLDAKADKKTIKDYLMAQYYSERAKCEARVDELIDVLYLLTNYEFAQRTPLR